MMTTVCSVRSTPAWRRALVAFPLESVGAYLLALLWISPLLYACWAAFRDPSAALSLDLLQGWTFENFSAAWARAPWLRYVFKTTLLVFTFWWGSW